MKKLFAFTVLFMNLSLLRADDIYFQQYGLNEGLSSNIVFGIAEDKHGLLWIATTEGVDKFDGLNFTHYSLPQLTANGVLDYMELFIQSDSKGQIWLATRTGLIYKYNVLKDEFELIYQFNNNLENGALVRLRAFYVDHIDRLLLSMFDGVWSMHGDTLQPIKILENANVYSMIQDENSIYFFGDDTGIQIRDSSFRKVEFLNIERIANSTARRVTRLYINDESQSVLGVGEKEGVFNIQLLTKKWTFPEELQPYKGLAIRAIHRFSEDEIIIGIDGIGLVFWDVKTNSISREVIYQDGKKGTLSSNAIYSIFENKDGILFISTHRGGINVYNPNKLNFGLLNSVSNNSSSITNNYVLAFHEISPGKIAFGTYEGISIWDKNRNTWQHLKDNDKSNSEVILSLAADNDKNIWATSFTNSIMSFEKRGNSYAIRKSLRKLVEIRPMNLTIDNQNRIWFSTFQNRAYQYSINENELIQIPIQGVLTLKILDDHLLVFGNENGLSFFDTEAFKLHQFNFIEESEMKMRIIKCLRIDDKKRLWVGTKMDGLFMIDFYNETVSQFSTKNGLPVNHIFGIATGEGEVWISTLKGISKIDKDLNVVNYNLSDGIASTDFNYDAALRDSDGVLYFGTNDGVITLSPNQIVPEISIKNILFSEFRLNHERIFPSENSPMRVETNSVNEIKLKHHQNSFSLGFESVDFVQPEHGYFHWKLENFDDDWLTSDQLTNITYTNLNSGDYNFHLKVVDEQGSLISNQKSIKIFISKPWWVMPWAFALYAAVILLLLWTMLHFYRLQINSRNSSERLGFLINLAHEIKTPLLLIKAPLNDLIANENIGGVVRKNVNIALSSAERLHKQMIQFLDMGNLTKIENTLTFEHTDLIKFIQDKIIVFKVLADKKDITLSFKHSEQDFPIKMDKEILDKILSNLMSNAIKYTNEGGKVTVNVEVLDNECSVLVSDSGIGIIKSEQKNIFKPFYRTNRAKQSGSTGNGMGLVLSCNLAKMLNGKLTLKESSEMGSIFEFRFPFEISSKTEIVLEPDEEQLKETEKSTKLLLVEDDEELLNYSKDKLQAHYKVITAKNGVEGLEKCMKLLPNIIISDVMMPQMNGLQFCMKLKSDITTSHIPVILFTGLDSKEEIVEGLEAGADDYIVKPFEFDILIKKIDTLLNNRLILQKKFLSQNSDEEDVGFASKLDDEWISKVNKFVEEHIDDSKLTPDVLYRQFGMSRSAFYHKTKSLVDLSPIELIRTIRLKKAKSLLRNSDLDISEVAYQLGFNDPKYFSTLFKRYFGETPSSFITQKRTLKEN